MSDEKQSDDQTIRLFLAEKLTNPDIDTDLMEEKLDRIYQWVKTGQRKSASVTQLKVK